jgi:hypothetical protein
MIWGNLKLLALMTGVFFSPFLALIPVISIIQVTAAMDLLEMVIYASYPVQYLTHLAKWKLKESRKKSVRKIDPWSRIDRSVDEIACNVLHMINLAC